MIPTWVHHEPGASAARPLSPCQRCRLCKCCDGIQGMIPFRISGLSWISKRRDFNVLTISCRNHTLLGLWPMLAGSVLSCQGKYHPLHLDRVNVSRWRFTVIQVSERWSPTRKLCPHVKLLLPRVRLTRTCSLIKLAFPMNALPGSRWTGSPQISTQDPLFPST